MNNRTILDSAKFRWSQVIVFVTVFFITIISIILSGFSASSPYSLMSFGLMLSTLYILSIFLFFYFKINITVYLVIAVEFVYAILVLLFFTLPMVKDSLGNGRLYLTDLNPETLLISFLTLISPVPFIYSLFKLMKFALAENKGFFKKK